MKNTTALIMLSLGLGLVGCAGDDDSIVLKNSLTQDKADSVNGKTVVVSAKDDVAVQLPSSTAAQLKVPTSNDEEVIVEGNMYVLSPAAGSRLELSLDQGIGETFTDFEFMLFARHKARAPEWTAIELEGQVTVTPLFGQARTRDVTLNSFENVVIDLEEKKLRVQIDRGQYTLETNIDVPPGTEFAVYAFPRSGWGSLEGDYSFTLVAQGTQAPADNEDGAENPQDPDTEEEPADPSDPQEDPEEPGNPGDPDGPSYRPVRAPAQGTMRF